ncbi:MAG: penicillin-binding protein [Flavobacteriaceae bacterium]|nr:penicillin-binding protein [Flavobacteriaceae bacterium]|tara:strand:+ start:13085 stop:13636 length:552 start_codon:yes stop_codon:yes gene_type:complete
MKFSKLFFSCYFLKQLSKIIAFLIVVGLLLIKILDFITHKNEYIVVPDIKSMTLEEGIVKLNENKLRYEVIDSVKFNPDLKPYAIINLFPESGSEVKKNRKIYLTLNPSGYRKIIIPNIIQITRRNAESILKAVGFVIGKISYVDNIGKDMVLEIRYNQKKIAPGSILPKKSSLDLILGNGKF